MSGIAKKKNENLFVNPIGHPRDRIIINESIDIPREGIFIALNGYSFLCKTGVPIDLPRPVRLMLDTRIKTDTVMVDDGNGRMISHTRDIPRITYTVVQLDVNAPPAAPVATPPVAEAQSEAAAQASA